MFSTFVKKYTSNTVPLFKITRRNFKPSINIQNFKNKYATYEQTHDKPVVNINEIPINTQIEKIAGRILSIRKMSKNLTFMDLSSNGASLQLAFDSKKLSPEQLKNIEDIKRGYILGLEGIPFKTKTGELSLLVNELEILSKCEIDLPIMNRSDKEMLINPEVRYSKRYLDLIVNNNHKNYFAFRSKVIKFIRNFLESEGFLEVETPILSHKAGGALAHPFITHSNAIKQDLFLRVAPELYLKQLIIGGYEKVFEIGKNFRNEDISIRHNPEFTSCEFYQSYSNYLELIDFTKKMFREMCKQLNVISFRNPENDDVFQIFDVTKELEAYFNKKISFDYENKSDFYAQFDKLYEEYIQNLSDNKSGQTNPNKANISTKKKIEKLIEYIIEPKCTPPTFIINHPCLLSPLAKSHKDNKYLAERFEFFINKIELINAYSELNDPSEQLERFLEQKNLTEKYNREEIHPMDDDFIEALNHGMPPTAGWGLGIDRLCMILLELSNIKEVILFPLMNVQK